MQDEPGPGLGFSRKMSLKGKLGMLGIDHQHGRLRRWEPGADPGVPGGSGEVRFNARSFQVPNLACKRRPWPFQGTGNGSLIRATRMGTWRSRPDGTERLQPT